MPARGVVVPDLRASEFEDLRPHSDRRPGSRNETCAHGEAETAWSRRTTHPSPPVVGR
jgi:hypothetical protein